MLTSNQLEYIMEAHNGLSAKIVEEAGFKGIWGSGLSISAQLGVRDSNEASYTQVLEVQLVVSSSMILLSNRIFLTLISIFHSTRVGPRIHERQHLDPHLA
jgi:hypothetical protein